MRGVWTLHPRSCYKCDHRWHYSDKCHKNLAKKIWQCKRECECPKSIALTIGYIKNSIKSHIDSSLTLHSSEGVKQK